MTPGKIIPVLIIGGGPVGFSMALDLAWRGCPSVLVERDPGTASVLLAKANGLDERTMEHFRRWGVADDIAAVGFPEHLPGDTVYATSLTGAFLGRSPMAAIRDDIPRPGTAEKRRRCPQYELDGLLCRKVLSTGLTTIRYSTSFHRTAMAFPRF